MRSPLPSLLLALFAGASCSPLGSAAHDTLPSAPASDPAIPLAESPTASPRLAIEPAALAGDRVAKALELDAPRKLALVLDRPLYRPGETVWARSFDLGSDTLDGGGASAEVAFVLVDPRGNEALRHARPSDRGEAHATLDLPASLPGGLYTLRLEAGDRSAERRFVVAGFEEPKIRKELDLLREAYGPGDEVSAALKLATAGGGPLVDHPVEVLVQVGGVSLPTVAARTDLDGEAIVRFELPPDLDRSDVLMTVLVEEGGWQESISRPVPVVLDEVKVEWFPEGGDLVTSLPGRVYLRARNALGEPADIAGVVHDDLGNEVAVFRTVHDGLGRLPLTPQPGRRYTARLTEPSALAGRELPLPQAKAEGCVLRTFDDLDGKLPELRVGVRCTAKRTVVVAGTHRHRLLDSAAVSAGPEEAVVYLAANDPAVDRAQGVARVTVLDEAMEPLAERLVYRNRSRVLDIDISPDKPQYGPRDEVVLKLTARDPDGKPVAADLALSVADDRLLKLADDENGDLLTDLHLSPWLGGQDLDDPSWYLDPEEEDGALGLDLVMGTYGWRRFARVLASAPLSDVGEGAKAKREEGKVGKKEAKAKGNRREIDRQIAENAGVLGSLDAPPAQIGGLLGDDALQQGLAGLIGAPAAELGAGGLGTRGVGIGGGGTAEGLGGLGTQGMGSGASGYGKGGGYFGAHSQGSGNFGAKGEGGIGTVGGDPIILGALDRTLIDEVVKRHMNQIRYCYQRELVKNPTIRGKVTVKFTIAKDGSVSAASVKSSTMNNASVENCIVGRFMRMQFPSPNGGGIVIVSYPFLFHPGDNSARWQEPPSSPPPRPRFAIVREFPRPDYRSDRRPARRTDFRSTVMWAPSVRTGEDGTAELRFPLSDAVTTFSVVAQGVGAGHAGRATREIHSTLPFSLDVPIPQQLSFGDRLLLPIRLTSRRDEPVDVALATSVGAPLRVEDETDHQQIALDPLDAQTTLVGLLVPQGRGSAEVTVAAASGDLTDAITRTIEVVPRGFPDRWSASGELEGQTEHTVDLAGAMPGSVKGQLTLYPNTLSALLDGMEDMVQIPGGCFEQTSSTNYPNVLVLKHLDRSGRSPSLQVDRAAALSTGYMRLVGYRIPAGGFETFGQGPGKEVLSAYGLMQFTDMREVWPSVEAGVIDGDVDFLFAARDGKGGYRNSGSSSHAYGAAPQEINDAFITWALVRTGHREYRGQQLDVELQRQAEQARTARDPYLLALATLTLQHTDPTAAANAAARLVKMQQDDGMFPGASVTVVGSRGQNREVETTALATLALLGSHGHAMEVRRAVQWLASRRSPYGWGSTQATVLALAAIEGASQARASEETKGSVQVYVDGEPIRILSWTGDEQRPLTLDLTSLLSEGPHTVSLHARGASVPYALESSWTRLTPADAPDAPLEIETALAVTESELGVPVRLSVAVRNRSGEGVASPLARVGLPAGVRIETRQLEQLRDRGQIAFFETRPREVTLYWEGFAAGEGRDIALDLIPEVPGTFSAPPSSVYPYYDGELTAWAEGPELRIVP